jgi:hypothetical protein
VSLTALLIPPLTAMQILIKPIDVFKDALINIMVKLQLAMGYAFQSVQAITTLETIQHNSAFILVLQLT